MMMDFSLAPSAKLLSGKSYDYDSVLRNGENPGTFGNVWRMENLWFLDAKLTHAV
jgi:hypothetical protein